MNPEKVNLASVSLNIVLQSQKTYMKLTGKMKNAERAVSADHSTSLENKRTVAEDEPA